MSRIGSWSRSTFLCIVLTMAAFACCTAPHAQPVDTTSALQRKLRELQSSGQFTDALPLAMRLVDLAKVRSGEASAEYADALEALGETYLFQSLYPEAEPIYRRVLAIREKVAGPQHKSVLSTLDALANLYRLSNRPQLAEPLLKRALAEREGQLGPDSPQLAATLDDLAQVQIALQRFGDAEGSVRRALGLVGERDPAQTAKLLTALSQIERGQGRLEEAAATLQRALALHDAAARGRRPDPTQQMTRLLTVLQLGTLYQQLNRIEEAGQLAEQALDVVEKLLGPDHPVVASTLEAVASTRAYAGRYAEAEAMRKRALAINERAYGREHITVASSLQGLGHLYRLQDRFDEALPLLLSGMHIAEKKFGPDHAQIVPHLAEIADLYKSQRRFAEAEPLLKRALANLERGGDANSVVSGVQTIRVLQSLAQLHQSQGRHAEARPYLDRAVGLSERVFGPDHMLTGGMVGSLALLVLDQDLTDEAERLFQRALLISAKSGGDSLDHAHNMVGMGIVYRTRSDWANAYASLKSASQIYITHEKRAGAGAKSARSDAGGQQVSHADAYLLQAVTAYRLAESDPQAADALRDDAFQLAKRAQNSQAAAALGQMSARFASGSGALAALVRERQDRAKELRALDARLTAAYSMASDRRNAESEAALRTAIQDITTRLEAIDARLVREFPDYSALSDPQPLSIAATQKLLGPGEALVLVMSRPQQSLVWVIAKDNARWALASLGEAGLAREVTALRCGLDAAAWTGAGLGDCQSLLHVTHSANTLLPFDLVRAHGLYARLLGPFEDMISGKRLLIAAGGPLAALPFEVLVVERPETAIPAEAAAYAHQAWLIKRHAVSVLPSVSSLRSLRGAARSSKAARAFIGFGNPLLLGIDGTDRSAWAKQSCVKDVAPQWLQVTRAPLSGALSKLFRGSVVNTAALHRQMPLPETADELCEVARQLGADARDVYLGERATEGTIKKLNATNGLAGYRTVHFATHGLLAGETETLGSGAEPALLLTPPSTASEADDGLLTASEVAQLKLDAEWVVLSACNTASADKGGGEALSGLARAFFYAGARALLVSHWYVDSDAAVKLVTSAFSALKRDPAIGRAEAMRRAALSVMADQSRAAPSVPAAHPSVWGPFAVVGEGGSAQ
jgi:CHAT domain-containing protein